MSLGGWYQLMFALRQFHKYSDRDMLAWLPFERDIYVDMLLKHLQDEKTKQQQK